MTQFPEWQDAYLEASTETDSDELPLRISQELRAIASPLGTVPLDSISPKEFEALKDARVTLRGSQQRPQRTTDVA